ncbi:MAG: hypothetical protein ACYS5V_12010, partial [Planctomycetota bacterium]
VVRNVRAVMSATPRWRDFHYADGRLAAGRDGAVEFTCRRTWKDLAADCRVRTAWSNGALTMTWDFTAATDMDLPVFRHQAALPAHVFAGGRATDGDKTVSLPGDRPRGGQFLQGARKATVSSADGRVALTAQSPASLNLHDERVYRGDGFLLTQGGPRGQVKAGDTWRVQLTITPGSR